MADEKQSEQVSQEKVTPRDTVAMDPSEVAPEETSALNHRSTFVHAEPENPDYDGPYMIEYPATRDEE